MHPTPLPEDYRSGFIALIGRPNVGKSTLVNQLVGEKVAITSPVAQTTRNRLRAILTTEVAQMVLVDTPGIHKPHHLLGERLVKSARSAIGEVDLVVLLLEGCERPGRGDAFIVNLLQQQSLPVLVALNKWDKLAEEHRSEAEEAYAALLQETNWPVHRCSALSGDGCAELTAAMAAQLPLGPQLYPPEMVSDQPERVLLGELIREQVLLHTREEVPHSVAVTIDRVEELPAKGKGAGRTAVLATVLVERKSQKGILIGKGGAMLK
ncbi:MAG: GTPase Era, partial [Cyanobacteriota bacterium]|nr:GTPase Era [Cyanobacteriota bacterium]